MKVRWILLLGALIAGVPCSAAIVAVNQAGYMTGAAKVMVTSAVADSFCIVNAVTRDTVFRGATTAAGSADPSTGLVTRRGDFSAFQEGGQFFVRTSTGDTSQHFQVADTVYNGVFHASLKGFYYQRCGTALAATNAGVWSHPACHMNDATFHATAESTGTVSAAGGWHDAGDYGKYVVNAGISVATLMMAYEYFPSSFAADDVNIPESGNGVPDILDEARWELAWLLKMQAANGGVFFKVTRTSFEGTVMPNTDTGTRYIYQLSSTATGDFAAVMARASRVFRPYDAAFADTCLAASLRAWSWLADHPSIVPAGGFQNPPGTSTGGYGDGNDGDERLWAAAEISVTTDDSSASAYFLGRYTSGGIISYPMGWQSVKVMAELTYLKGVQPGRRLGAVDTIRQALFTYCAGVTNQSQNNAFGVALSTGDYYWGSNSVSLNMAFLLILGYEQGGDPALEDAALAQLHYILGVNGLAHSYVTGIGGNSTRFPHHRPSRADGITAPVPGLLSGGPDHNIGDDAVLSAAFTSSTPPALCFLDNADSYASNEICINWNAPLVFVAGYFARTAGPTAVGTTFPQVPMDIRLLQNYPNPFNGTTVIRFVSSRPAALELRVTDLLGRTVSALALGSLAAGEHRVSWNATNATGTSLSSGTYFYYLATGGRRVSEVRHLALIR